MRDVYAVKEFFREKYKRSFSSGESQMINVIKYSFVFIKYFVIFNFWKVGVKNFYVIKM